MTDPHSRLLDPRQWIDRQSVDPWYWGYCFQGAVILGLVPILVSWSPLIVAATALTGRLTTIGQGAGMGVFNATTAIAAVSSAVIGGPLAQHTGYAQVAWLAAATATVGIVLLTPLLRRA